ncbi:DUF5105 domain-containing protein [Eubacteriales bacterium OttesenSCG-928-N14]|nr:DUF5105 domain-containing protein [Eubacteriales bacterium OttesenSCG-928-N14]
MKKTIILLVALAMVFALAACGGGSADTSSASGAFDAGMTALKKLDGAGMEKYIVGFDADDVSSLLGDLTELGLSEEEAKDLFVTMLNKLSWKVLAEEMDSDGKSATLEIEVTMPDMEAMATHANAQLMTWIAENPTASKEDIIKEVISAFKAAAGESGTKSETGEAKMVKEDSGWMIKDMDVDLQMGF